MRILDIHIHLGSIPSAKSKQSVPFIITPESVAEHVKKFNITDAVLLYDVYENIEKLHSLVPECNLIGLQYVADPTNTILDLDKPFFHGVKLHSHRSKTGDLVGTEYTSQETKQLLNQLRADDIVLYHTQNPTSNRSANHVRMIAELSIEYPWLKHIIGHSGAYGMMCYKPQRNNYDFSDKQQYKNYLSFMTSFICMRLAVKEAIELAELQPNVFLDTSTYIQPKAELFVNSERWSIGSDFPLGSEPMHNFESQMKKFEKVTGQQRDDINNRGIKFIEDSLGVEKELCEFTKPHHNKLTSQENW